MARAGVEVAVGVEVEIGAADLVARISRHSGCRRYLRSCILYTAFVFARLYGERQARPYVCILHYLATG